MNLQENINRIKEVMGINESVIPVSIKRRLNSEKLGKYIETSEHDLLFYCDHYVDVEDYVSDVIRTATGNFLVYGIYDNIEDEDYYDDLFNYVENLCWDLYSEPLKDTYKKNCIDKKNK
jgi:translation initiation factor RLI1